MKTKEKQSNKPRKLKSNETRILEAVLTISRDWVHDDSFNVTESEKVKVQDALTLVVDKIEGLI